jgi:Protein of unknown function (DUF2442)
MVKNDDWVLPRRRAITKATLDRAIATEEAVAPQEHHARLAWFDRQHDVVAMVLTDGRVFGAERGLIPSLRDASPRQLGGLQTTEDGAFLVVDDLDLHINVDGLVTRLLEESPSDVRRLGGRLAGMATSSAKAAASARNGRLGGRPRREPREVA